MSKISAISPAPGPTTCLDGVDYATIDWVKVWATLTDIESHIEDLRGTTDRPYLDMLYEARVCPTSERPEPLQKLLDNDYIMDGILAMLEKAADETINTSADQVTLMTWQARYIIVILQTTRMRYEPDPLDTGFPLAADPDFNSRLDAVVAWLKAEFVTILTDLDTLLPGMRYEEVYTMSGPPPSLSNIGTPIADSELQLHQDDILQAAILDDNYERDHRMRCALCLSPYTADDPAFQLTCGHVVGKTCITTWLNSTNAQATACPHCKQVLCAPRMRTMVSPTPEQVVRADALRAHLEKVGNNAAQVLRGLRETYGLVEAQKVADDVVGVVNADLVRNGVQFRLLSKYAEDLGKLVIGVGRW